MTIVGVTQDVGAIGLLDENVTKITVERHKGSWWVVLYVHHDVIGGWNGPYTDKADAEKTANLNRLSYGLEIESTGHAC